MNLYRLADFSAQLCKIILHALLNLCLQKKRKLKCIHMIHACMDYDPWCISVELVQMQHMTTQKRLHVTTLTGDIYKRIICMVIAENNDQWPKESNMLQCSQSCSEVRRETNVQS